MDKFKDLMFCVEPICQQPTRTFSTSVENLEKHSKHELKSLQKILECINIDYLQNFKTEFIRRIQCIESQIQNTFQTLEQIIQEFLTNITNIKKWCKKQLDESQRQLNSHIEEFEKMKKLRIDIPFINKNQDLIYELTLDQEYHQQIRIEHEGRLNEINNTIKKWMNQLQHCNLRLFHPVTLIDVLQSKNQLQQQFQIHQQRNFTEIEFAKNKPAKFILLKHQLLQPSVPAIRLQINQSSCFNLIICNGDQISSLKKFSQVFEGGFDYQYLIKSGVVQAYNVINFSIQLQNTDEFIIRFIKSQKVVEIQWINKNENCEIKITTPIPESKIQFALIEDLQIELIQKQIGQQ